MNRDSARCQPQFMRKQTLLYRIAAIESCYENPYVSVEIERDWDCDPMRVAVRLFAWTLTEPCQELVALLLDATGNGLANAKSEHDVPVLLLAVTHHQVETVRQLVRAGADVNVSTRHAQSILAIAVQAGSIEIVDILLTHGADSNDPVLGVLPWRSLLIYAIQMGKYEIVDLLIRHGANVRGTRYNGICPLHCAGKSASITRCLLQHGADVDQKTDSGKTALYFFARQHDVESIAVLLEHNANVNHLSNDSSCALGSVVTRDNSRGTAAKNTIDLLVKHGANLNGGTDGPEGIVLSKKTPIQIATEHSPALVPHLKRHLLVYAHRHLVDLCLLLRPFHFPVLVVIEIYNKLVTTRYTRLNVSVDYLTPLCHQWSTAVALRK